MNPISLTNLQLTRIFFALILLLAMAHGSGYVFQRLLKIPKVIGEIIGGLLLGPTVLGFFYPAVYSWIFQAFPSEGQLIAIIYWLGLVLLMFISGFEIQKAISRQDKKLIGIILLGSTVVPFALGWLMPQIFNFLPYIGSKGNMLSLTLIVASSIAVTSIPVISKIFMDLEIINSRFAKIVLAAATVEDTLLWIALAVATGLAGGQVPTVSSVVLKVIVILLFFVIALFAGPKVFKFFSQSRFNVFMKSSATGYVLMVCFLFAAIASVLNINVVYGAFLAGIVVATAAGEQMDKVRINIKESSLGFFVPLYFAVVGLQIDLVHHFAPVFFLVFLLAAVLIKTISTVLAARLARLNWLSSFNFGVAMNTRGGPGIVLATTAFGVGIINETFFSVLVLLAIVTSLASGYWFKYVTSKQWELLS